MGFPNTVTNAPAGYLSILLKAAGFNVTLSTNLASGLDAIDYAVKAIDDGRVRVAIAGGYDELSPATLVGLAEAGALAGAARGPEARDSVPLDRDRSGLFLGEGAGVLVLERLEDALEREANILGEIAGFGTSFCPSPDRASESMSKAMESALSSAGSGAKDVSCVLASANGSVEGDRQERLAIEKTFRDLIAGGAGAVPVTAIKSMVGECGGAAGPIQLMAAALSTRFNALPPTRGFRSGDPGSSLEISPSGRAVDCDTVLVNCFNGENNNSSMVVKKTAL
jgi:3-oxoacyl-[acyl-carrier-protein] synthase II